MTSSRAARVLIIIVVMVTVSVRCQQASECSSSSIKSCMNQQAPFSPNVPRPWTNTDYDIFCRQAGQFRSCVNNLACTSADQPQLYVSYQSAVGIVIGDEYLCSTEARSVFLENQACFTARLSLTSSFCRKISIPPNHASLSPRDQCRAERRYYRCLYAGLTSGCNEQIANAIVEFNTRKYTPPRVATINCNLTDGNYSIVEPADGAGNCSVQSIVACRGLVSHSPNLTADNIDLLCRQATEFASCVNTLQCPNNHPLCLDIQLLTGVKDGYTYMCSGDVKNTINNNLECIRSVLTHESLNPVHLTSSAAVCKFYETHIMKFYTSVRATCGNNDDVATVATTTIVKRLRPLINTAFDCQLTEGSTGCNLVKIFRCKAQQAPFSPSAPRSWTDADYDGFCNETPNLRTCINALNCSKSDGAAYVVHQRVVGISIGDQYLCSDTARPVLLANQACFATKLLSIHAGCSRRSFTFNDASASPVSESDQCKSHNNYYKCIYTTLKRECNEDTARVVVVFNVKKQQPELLATINCQLDMSSYLPSSAAMLSAVAVLPWLSGICAYLHHL